MKNKKAFSMVEVASVLAVIGLITILSAHTIQERFKDYYSRYYTAFDALNKAAYNTYVDTYCRADIASNDNLTDCIRDDKEGSTDYTKTGRPFPTKPEDLCKRLKEYLNATADSMCKDATIKNATDDEFNDKIMQFTLTNGYKFYFSDSKKIIIKHAGSTNKEIKYYIVYIDLNGAAKPNTARAEKAGENYSVKPDIVPFIVTYTGDVIPVGNPVFDKTYVSARVIDSNGNQTNSYTLDEARQLAFGDTPYTDIPMTLIPSFNAALPTVIKPDTNKHTKFGLNPNGNGVGIDTNNPSTKDMECKPGTFNCMLKIDENLEKRY